MLGVDMKIREELQEEGTVCAGAALPRKNVNLQRVKTKSGTQYNQSPLLPQTVFKFLSIIFQVKRNEKDKCIIGRIVFLWTVFLAMSYLALDLTYTIFDVKSPETKKSVTSAAFVLLNTLLWCALGVYANRLCRKLLQCTSFINSIRFHSKTLFKVPAVLLIVLLAVASISLASYDAHDKFWLGGGNSSCGVVNLDQTVCKALFIVRCIQSLVVLLYNMCIAFAVLSICRTHTIGVRRFIKALENDGIACESKHTKALTTQFSVAKDLADIYLPEQCYGDELDDEELMLGGGGDSPLPSEKTKLLNSTENHNSYGASSQQSTDDEADVGITFGKQVSWGENTQHYKRSSKKKPVKGPLDPRILSTEDIQFSYWKLASRMRYSSRAVQRWMATWCTFVILWELKWVIVWVKEPATYIEIPQFAAPLLMLVIMCTAYGETNVECGRIIPSITPSDERLLTISVLRGIPTGMTVFNHVLSYSDIVYVITALGLALCSRLVLDEFVPGDKS